MQLTIELEQELSSIISNYVNGNRKDAAKKIRGLNKKKLAHFIIHKVYLNTCAEAPLRGDNQYIRFSGFIMSALDNEV